MSALSGRVPLSAPQSIAGLLVAMLLATVFTGTIGFATLAGAHHLPWLLAIPFLLAVLVLPLAFAPGPGRWSRRTTRAELGLCVAVDVAALLALLVTAATTWAAPALALFVLQLVAVLAALLRVRIHPR